MNLIIINNINKEYQIYKIITVKAESFVTKNINEINIKNNLGLIVQVNMDTTDLDNKGYKINQTLFDNLIIDYNNNLETGQSPLDFWQRDL
ncbi:MAG: hypothetical protein HRT66_02075 [Flavobacteriaceae bacterium]|nr:hypothetical protein [Flavobacteriaceae bacterium]